MVRAINVAGREIGPGHPCFIIAEAGVNHNGDIAMARQLVNAAAAARADAVKFQTFKAERLATLDAPKADYQRETTGASEGQYEMLRRLELSLEMHQELMDYCKERSILFMSSPFDESSADMLASLGVAVLKVPSGEITNLPYLSHLSAKGLPMIVSTGMAHLGEVEEAVDTIEKAGNQDFVLLHCVSNYPASPSDVNLRAMGTMAAAFGVPVGYSDHTLGIEVALAAVSLGACVIEKHMTLDRGLPGPDHTASLEPEDFKAMVASTRTIERALGTGRKVPAASEASSAAAARKSLVAAREIPAGTSLTEDLIAIMRPGTGLPPAMRSYLIGRSVRVPVRAGELITLDMVG